MQLFCPGPHKVIPATQQIGGQAQLHILDRFRNYFQGRCPFGIVITELDYLGEAITVFQKPQYGLQTRDAIVSLVLDALREDYKRDYSSQFSYRKSDVLGICPDGVTCLLELIEMTTVGNRLSAEKQLRDKLALLQFVSNLHNLRAQILPSLWKPQSSFERFRKVAANSEEIMWICFEPTFRDCAGPGIILYEVHREKLQKELAKEKVPAEDQERIKKAIQALPPGITPEEAERRGREFARQTPGAGNWLSREWDFWVNVFIILACIGLILLLLPEEALAAAIAFAVGLVRAALAMA